MFFRAMLITLFMYADFASAESSLLQLRIMAENDVAAAYLEIQRLRSTKKVPSDRPKEIALLNLQSRVEFLLGHTNLAENHSTQSLAIASELSDEDGQADALLNLAKIALNQGKLELSTELTSRSANLLPKIEDAALASEIMFWQVLAYRRLGKEQESIRLALQALDNAERSGNQLALAFSFRGLALSYEQSHRNAEALEYSNKMLVASKKIPSKIFEAYSLQGLATRPGAQADFAKSEDLMLRAIGIYKELKTPFLQNIGRLSLARMYSEQRSYAKSIEVLTEAIDLYQQSTAVLGYWYALTSRCNAYIQTQDFVKAEQDAALALIMAKKMGDFSFHAQSLDLLASTAAAGGDYPRAYRLTLESAELRNSNMIQASKHNVSEAVSSYEQENQQKYINDLNQRNLQQERQIEQKHLQQRWLITLLISAVLLLFITVYFLGRLTRVNQKLRGLGGRLETIREEERKQIAQDIHDDMGQYLTTIRMDIAGINSLCVNDIPAIAEKAQALKALVDQAISVMRSIVSRIRPAPLNLGVRSALEWQTEEFTKNSGISCKLDISTDVPDLTSEKHMTTVFRIVQESFTNIIKHADATAVVVKVMATDRKFILKIQDNGRGFNNKDIRPNCFGLAGMQERVHMLDGQLTIRSQARLGTEICLMFSIPKEDS